MLWVDVAFVAFVALSTLSRLKSIALDENLKLMNRACALSPADSHLLDTAFWALNCQNLLYIRAFGSLSVHWVAENGQALEGSACSRGCRVLQSASGPFRSTRCTDLECRPGVQTKNTPTKSTDWELRAQAKSRDWEPRLRAQPETVEHTRCHAPASSPKSFNSTAPFRPVNT